ncbi:MAG: ATP-binding protein [Burkholderiaceae bacterium]
MRVSLFWRSFLLIAPMIAINALMTLQLLRQFDQSPPEQQLAWEIASVVNLTRTALVNTPAERRQLLLRELANEEGVRILPLEDKDVIEPLRESEPDEAALAAAVEARLQTLLGPTTRLAGKVDGQAGLWVSFDIDDDPYWLIMNRERFDRQVGPNWALIALIGLAISILVALFVSNLVNRPMARLASAIERLSLGDRPALLPEDAPTEIAEVNRRFNRMARDLAELESDRTTALAGVSHDVRTPLARLRLEIEMSGLPQAERDSMNEDIERIDQIVGKFLEYGRAGHGTQGGARPGQRGEWVALDALMTQIESSHRAPVAAGQLRLQGRLVPPDVRWRGDPLDLLRVFGNLIENACRYGRTPGGPMAEVDYTIERDKHGIRVRVRDHGPGVPTDQFERLLRPFSRLDPERSVNGGSGLGLAIVNRIAQRYGGQCTLAHADGGGLLVELTLKDD